MSLRKLGTGKGLVEWLKDVDPDQNLTGLSNLANIKINQPGRKLFRRNDLQPGIFIAYYDPNTGKPVLGHPAAWKNNSLEEPGVVATSAAKHSWAAPAKCEVVSISRVNNTDSFYVSLSITILGGTERELGTVPNNISGNDPGAGQTLNLTANFQKALEGVIILETGDQIHTTDENFTASDSCLTVILYRLVN